MSTISRTVDVRVPLRTAYDQWTQFTEFPRFMTGVHRVTQLDDRTTRWVTRVAGVRRDFDAEIVVQRPEQGISWHSLTGPAHSGHVRFEPLGDGATRVELTLEWHAQGFVESVGDSLHLVERRVEGDLAAFKGEATGGWRGALDDASGPDTGIAPEVALSESDVRGSTGTAAHLEPGQGAHGNDAHGLRDAGPRP